jgi:capsule polysaccharide export protein KpsE/RkpR
MKSHFTGIAKCNVSSNGNTIADQIASVTLDEIDEAINQIKSSSSSRNNNSAGSVIPDNPHILELL